jgi:hypothetical protein
VVLARGRPLAAAAATDRGNRFTIPGTFDVTALWAFAPDDVMGGRPDDCFIRRDRLQARSVLRCPRRLPTSGASRPTTSMPCAARPCCTGTAPPGRTSTSPGAISPSDLTSVWGSSRDDLWLGDSSNGRVFRWNGTAWSTGITRHLRQRSVGRRRRAGVRGRGVRHRALERGTPGPTSATAASRARPPALWGAAADDVWAVGDFTNLAHWDGAKWTDTVRRTTTTSTTVIRGVWGTAADDVWAVGDSGAISHWNGTAWSQTQYGKFSVLPVPEQGPRLVAHGHLGRRPHRQARAAHRPDPALAA